VRPRRHLPWFPAGMLLLAASGCSTYSTYTCPDPIGPIVRQDCEDYRVRYQNLQAKLSLSIGSFSIGGEVGQQKIRDPSELVQVMMHRMLALCHDYNSCRIDNAEYRRRRDEADRIFTAVMAVLEELKDPQLSTEQRARLSQRLVDMLQGRPAPATTPGKTSKPSLPPGRSRDIFRKNTSYFLASRYLPPRPPPPGRQVPYLLEARPSFQQQRLTAVRLELWGRVEEDDLLLLDDDIRCPVKPRGRHPLGTARCRGAFGARRSFTVTYVPGLTGKKVRLGRIDLSPESFTPRAWLAYQPEPLQLLPVEAERPWLIIDLSLPPRTSVSARCRRDGRPVEVDGQTALPVREASRLWWGGPRRYALPLPVILSYHGGAKKPGAGDWECRLSIDGLPRYRVRFHLLPDGRPEPLRRQRGRPGDLARPWWALELVKLPD